MQNIEHPELFVNELALKQLVSSNKVSIIYIHGTARSGSTIAEIIISHLANLAIHQPFRGTLQKCGGRFRTYKLDFDADIYDSACGLIVEQISQHLQAEKKIIVVIKELAGFFKPYIWQRWLKIPQQFLFTIREPHLQYMSWLSAMTDKVFTGEGKLQEKRGFVLEKAETTETSILSAEWEGTTISCNQAAWNASGEDFRQVKQAIAGTSKKLLILDSLLLRYKPEYAVKQLLKKLGCSQEQLSRFDFNCLGKSRQKIQDIRDKSRPMVRKANNSKRIHPLTSGEAINLDVFPSKSQKHIRQIIPLYLDLLYASEQIYLPTLAELATQTTSLIAANPFIAYAIASLHFQRQKIVDPSRVVDWLKSQAKERSHQSAINIDSFSTSFAAVDSYWRNKYKL